MKIAIAGIGYTGLSNVILLAQTPKVYSEDIMPEKMEIANKGKHSIVDKEIEKYSESKKLNLHVVIDSKETYEAV